MKANKSLWVLEDDPGARFVYDEILSFRYGLRFFTSLQEFRAVLSTKEYERPDLLIADLRLPDGSFLSYLFGEDRNLFEIPFLVVSSLDDLDALRRCFSEGAIDYLTKPFGKSELTVKLERIFAVDEKAPAQKGLLFLDPVKLSASTAHGRSVMLTAKEFQILSLLHQDPDYTISRQQMLSKVWDQTRVEAKTLDVHIFNLRKKLTKAGLDLTHVPPSSFRLSGDRMDQEITQKIVGRAFGP